MRPYTPNTMTGLKVALDDIHHRTADRPHSHAKYFAKEQRHAARQEAKKIARYESNNPEETYRG